MQHFLLDGAILLHRDKSAPDPALIRNDNEFEARGFQTAQCFRDPGENPNLSWIRTIVGIVHYGSVAIDKDGGEQFISHARGPPENLRQVRLWSQSRSQVCLRPPRFREWQSRPLRSALPL